MEPDAAITVSMVQVAASVAGLMVLGATTLWAAYRFVKNEREKGEDRIMAALKAVETVARAEDEKLHGRISTVAKESVRRDDYHGDQQRTQDLLKAIQDDLRTGIRGLQERIDRRIDARVSGSD